MQHAFRCNAENDGVRGKGGQYFSLSLSLSLSLSRARALSLSLCARVRVCGQMKSGNPPGASGEVHMESPARALPSLPSALKRGGGAHTSGSPLASEMPTSAMPSSTNSALQTGWQP